MNTEVAGLIKFITENKMDENPKVMALLCAVARNPESGYKSTLFKLMAPKMVENALLSDPFSPYPSDEDFEGDINIGLVGIHNSYTRRI